MSEPHEIVRDALAHLHPDMESTCPSAEYAVAYRDTVASIIRQLRTLAHEWEAAYASVNGSIPYPPELIPPSETFMQWRRAHWASRGQAAKALGADVETIARRERGEVGVPPRAWAEMLNPCWAPTAPRLYDIYGAWGAREAEYREPKEEWELPKPRKLYTHRPHRI